MDIHVVGRVDPIAVGILSSLFLGGILNTGAFAGPVVQNLHFRAAKVDAFHNSGIAFGRFRQGGEADAQQHRGQNQSQNFLHRFLTSFYFHTPQAKAYSYSVNFSCNLHKQYKPSWTELQAFFPSFYSLEPLMAMLSTKVRWVKMYRMISGMEQMSTPTKISCC